MIKQVILVYRLELLILLIKNSKVEQKEFKHKSISLVSESMECIWILQIIKKGRKSVYISVHADVLLIRQYKIKNPSFSPKPVCENSAYEVRS